MLEDSGIVDDYESQINVGLQAILFVTYISPHDYFSGASVSIIPALVVYLVCYYPVSSTFPPVNNTDLDLFGTYRLSNRCTASFGSGCLCVTSDHKKYSVTAPVPSLSGC